MKYLNHKITRCGKYPAIFLPEHNRATSSGLVYLHILEAERKLGRFLEEEECVHHIDENKDNYDMDNLMIFKTKSDHTRYHIAIKNSIQYKLIEEKGVYTCELSENQRRCPVCGNQKDYKAKLCIKCEYINRAKKIPPKEVLIDDLKKYRKTSIIGKKYGVTAQSVKKWLQKYNLPYLQVEIKKVY